MCAGRDAQPQSGLGAVEVSAAGSAGVSGANGVYSSVPLGLRFVDAAVLVAVGSAAR